MEEWQCAGLSYDERLDDGYADQLEVELARVARVVEAEGVTEAFDQRGRLYEIALALSPAARQGDLEEMANWFGVAAGKLRGKVAVDIAAGTGFLTKSLLKWTRETVYAVDPSRVQLTSLLRQCHPSGPVWPVIGSPDQEAIFDQIPAGTIDVVTSFGGLHHVANHEALFANVARLLKPGGRFIAADVGLGSTLQRHFDEVVAKKCLTGHAANWLSVDRLKVLCEEAFLGTPRVCEQVPLTWTFRSEREMALFFKGLHAYPQSEAEVLGDLRETLGWYVEDDLIHLTGPMLFFEVTKP